MRREFSAGGVLVRRLRGALDGGGDPAGAAAAGPLGAAEGPDRPRRERRGDGAARDRGGDRRRAAARSASSATSATGSPGRASGSSRSSRSSSSATRAASSATSPRRSATRSTRFAGCRSTTRRGCSPTRASARWPRERSRSRQARTYDRAPVPAFALNFYSPVVEAQLRSHRKTATIRLGDKSRKYTEGHDRRRCSSAPATARASTSSTP